MRRMVKLFATAAALMAALAIAACGNDDESGSSGDATKVAYSNPIGAQPGQQDIVFGFNAGANELGWTAESIDANLSPDKQVADIATMVTQGQDGIASWTLDPGAAAGAYGQAKAAGIPVIGVNSEGTGIDATVWWQLNLCGTRSPVAELAKYIAKEKPGAKVLAIGGPPVPSIQAYEKCFAENAEKNGLTVVGKANNTKDTAATAQPIVADLLTKYPDVDAVWAYNDASALGASAALTSDGKKVYDGSNDGVIVFGQNGDADAIMAIRERRLTGTLDPDPVATGWALIKALSGFVGEDKVANPPKELVVKSDTWTLENLGDYRPPRERSYTLDTVPLVGVSTR
jgi:ribose transport system substrate-binding protein